MSTASNKRLLVVHLILADCSFDLDFLYSRWLGTCRLQDLQKCMAIGQPSVSSINLLSCKRLLCAGAAGANVRIGYLLDINMVAGLFPIAYMPLYASNRALLCSEAANHTYSPAAYFWAITIGDFPIQCLAGLTFAMVSYGLANMRYTARAVLLNALVTTVTHLISCEVRHMCAFGNICAQVFLRLFLDYLRCMKNGAELTACFVDKHPPDHDPPS